MLNALRWRRAFSDYESEAQELESLRARYFGAKLDTPKPAGSTLDAAT